jgi:Flp pilus assembly protein TadG
VTRRAAGDDGTILVLTLGFVAILLVMVGVVVNVSSVVLAKRGVASAADGAAVSAAQALDLATLYDRGLGSQVPLSVVDANARVQAYAAGVRSGQPGLQLTLQSVADGTAVVQGVRVVRPPFPLFGTGDVTVTAVARARAPVIVPGAP